MGKESQHDDFPIFFYLSFMTLEGLALVDVQIDLGLLAFATTMWVVLPWAFGRGGGEKRTLWILRGSRSFFAAAIFFIIQLFLVPFSSIVSIPLSVAYEPLFYVPPTYDFAFITGLILVAYGTYNSYKVVDDVAKGQKEPDRLSSLIGLVPLFYLQALSAIQLVDMYSLGYLVHPDRLYLSYAVSLATCWVAFARAVEWAWRGRITVEFKEPLIKWWKLRKIPSGAVVLIFLAAPWVIGLIIYVNYHLVKLF